MKRVLLIGGSGQLGTAIRRPGATARSPHRRTRELDIAQRAHALRAAIDARSARRPRQLPPHFTTSTAARRNPSGRSRSTRSAVGVAAALAAMRGAVFVTRQHRLRLRRGERDAVREERPAASALRVRHLETRRRTPRRGRCARAFVVRTCGAVRTRRDVDARAARAFVERVLAQRAPANRCASSPTSSRRRRSPATSPTRCGGSSRPTLTASITPSTPGR